MKLDPIYDFIRDIPEGGAIIVVSDGEARSALIEAVACTCGSAALESLTIVIAAPRARELLASRPLEVIPFRVMPDNLL